MKESNFKKINIGTLINQRVVECEIEMSRLCKFFNCTEEEISQVYKSESLDTENLLKWSRILEYDFFRIYSQHLILYSPPSKTFSKKVKTNEGSKIPSFRKNIYTQEVIAFILEMLENEEKTKLQIMEEYNIPKTTLYKWIKKYKK